MTCVDFHSNILFITWRPNIIMVGKEKFNYDKFNNALFL